MTKSVFGVLAMGLVLLALLATKAEAKTEGSQLKISWGHTLIVVAWQPPSPGSLQWSASAEKQHLHKDGSRTLRGNVDATLYGQNQKLRCKASQVEVSRTTNKAGDEVMTIILRGQFVLLWDKGNKTLSVADNGNPLLRITGDRAIIEAVVRSKSDKRSTPRQQAAPVLPK